MLSQFQRGAQQYLDDLPADEDYLAWLALMQHYGTPTRLLDFTYSFYVAAFFAMEDRPQRKTTEAAIWAINCTVLDARTKAANIDVEIRLDGEKRRKHVNSLIAKNIAAIENEPFVLAVEPHRMDKRLIAQQGVFMFPCKIGASFYENFGATLGLPAPDARPKPVNYCDIKDKLTDAYRRNEIDTLQILLPYEVPWNDRAQNYSEAYTIMRDLKKMNITPATLFPGLDGFARSMAYHLRHANELPPVYSAATHPAQA